MLQIGAAQTQGQEQSPGGTPERQQQRDSQVQQKYLTTSKCFRAGQCFPRRTPVCLRSLLSVEGSLGQIILEGLRGRNLFQT